MSKVDKKALCDAIRTEVAKQSFYCDIQLEPWAKITDVRKFLDSHLAVVEHNEGQSVEPYAERLKKVLKMIGIDTLDLAKKIQKENKNNPIKTKKNGGK